MEKIIVKNTSDMTLLFYSELSDETEPLLVLKPDDIFSYIGDLSGTLLEWYDKGYVDFWRTKIVCGVDWKKEGF